MNTRTYILIASIALAAAFVRAVDARADEAEVDFAREVLPILSNKCFVCHGPSAKKEIRLDSYEAATQDLGGYRAIDPKAPEDSEVLIRIHDEADPMPPKKAEKQLTDRERDLIDRWVKQGGAYAKHWAFVPPVKASPNINAKRHHNAIDAFIDRQLQSKGIDFAPRADRATLARRAALILTGLPPEPEQLAAFLADESDGAYEGLVDQLLASPRYGEHQTRYWLDAVRYGDTHGLHLDNKRGIYPYRDWVVFAFNNNLPLDEFLIWQLAGDLLENPRLEQLVATGFVRMNPSTSEGGVIPAEFQAKNNFDRTETLGTVLMGMTLNCARCHTHKYDPITQTEYYRLLAFFNSTAEGPLDGNKYEYGPTVKAPGNQNDWHLWQRFHADQKRLTDEAGKRPEVDKAQWQALSVQERFDRLSNPKGLFAGLQLHDEANKLKQAFAESQKRYTTTLVAKELPKPRETRFLERGEYNLPVGDPLEPGILEVMGAFPKDAPRNRLGLAQWLTGRAHPLTARVLMNQMWQQVFGDGLVRTPEDFGLQGEQPTHPQLLDWLAVELQDSGWDKKHMMKLMVMSRTFQQASARRSDVADPENRLYARGPSHRMDAEMIRDVGLWASGLLDEHMGGEGVKPYQPPGMWAALSHPASNTKKYQRDQGERLYRRSLYVYWKRTSPHPMMTLFDAPSREASCVRRSRTNTPLQSLGLLNETQRIEMARTFAERLIKSYKDDGARLEQVFKLLASRPPNARERAACMKLLATMRERYKQSNEDAVALLSTGEAARDASINAAEHAAWTQVAVTVLASDVAIVVY